MTRPFIALDIWSKEIVYRVCQEIDQYQADHLGNLPRQWSIPAIEFNHIQSLKLVDNDFHTDQPLCFIMGVPIVEGVE